MFRICLFWLALLTFLSSLASAAANDPPPPNRAGYRVGDLVPIECLNRTADSGEHIQDESTGALQYIPFPTCLETKTPLSLRFGIEEERNCTIDFVSDEFFHILEFYVHNDAPLTCRVPARPLSASDSRAISGEDQKGAIGSQSDLYIPLVFALSGTLQLSHLHIANNLNVLLHALPYSQSPGVIDAATAYSVSALNPARSVRVIIGDPLPLRLSVRWYPTVTLPSGWGGVGGHLYLSTFVYCGLSAGAATALCLAYFRGIELPRRLKMHGRDRTWGGGPLDGGGGKSNGYGYGVAGGYGLPGKRE